MKIEVNRNVLAGALIALGKLVCRTSPVEVYRCVQIEKRNEWLYLRTCNPDEMMEFKTGCESEGEFASVIPFDELRNAVKGSKNKLLIFEYEAGVLQIDGKAMIAVKVEWPKVCECPVETFPKVLPENFIGLLVKAAPIVNRNEPRRVLQGINLSKDGITVTNGKELVNIVVFLKISSADRNESNERPSALSRTIDSLIVFAVSTLKSCRYCYRHRKFYNFDRSYFFLVL